MAEVTEQPDPTDRTLQALEQGVAEIRRDLNTRVETRQREVKALQTLIEVKADAAARLSDEKMNSIRRELEVREAHRVESEAKAEAHRLELKADGEKTLTTATIARDAAVQAALAAAEKMRDQQAVAFQLATAKAEEGSKDQMKQQSETFSAAITGLSMGFNDVKASLGELRAEARGNRDQVVAQRDTSGSTRGWMALWFTLVFSVIGVIFSMFNIFVLH